MRLKLLLASVAVVLASPVFASDADNARMDALVEQAVQRYQLPGIAVGVIEDGKVVRRITRGELAEGEGAAVNDDSLNLTQLSITVQVSDAAGHTGQDSDTAVAMNQGQHLRQRRQVHGDETRFSLMKPVPVEIHIRIVRTFAALAIGPQQGVVDAAGVLQQRFGNLFSGHRFATGVFNEES